MKISKKLFLILATFVHLNCLEQEKNQYLIAAINAVQKQDLRSLKIIAESNHLSDVDKLKIIVVADKLAQNNRSKKLISYDNTQLLLRILSAISIEFFVHNFFNIYRSYKKNSMKHNLNLIELLKKFPEIKNFFVASFFKMGLSLSCTAAANYEFKTGYFFNRPSYILNFLINQFKASYLLTGNQKIYFINK